MKRITTFFSLLFLSGILFGQNVKKIENLKDSWDLTYTYTGEIKDGKPHGMGVAKYATGNVLQYAGSFVNGMYSGKGTMYLNNGAFLTGEWKNGKLNGKGANLTESGDLYIGDFANGVKNGRGTLFYKDNSVLIGNYKEDKLNGRCINIWKDGSIISDCIYANDKRNGTGLQYEVKAKKLYEGEWRDDKWAQAATVSFSSFLKASSFIGEMNDEHILMGPVNKNNMLNDTSYYYDLKTKKRYFGYYNNGHLKNGFIVRDDSTCFLGPLDENGAAGYAYDYKVNKYFTEGNYTNDLLNGKVTDLDLAKKSVYFGDAVNGSFTGNAYYFNDKGTMYAGNYNNGKFTGTGYRLEATGRYTSGTWIDGQVEKLNTLITANGDIITGNPKTFAEGINVAIKAFPGIFDDIYGAAILDEDILSGLEEIDKDYALTFTSSVITIPGSIGKNIICEDFDENTFFYSKFLQTDNFAKAKARYNELAAQLQSVVITNKLITGKQKLTGKIIPPDNAKDKTESEFIISGDGRGFENFRVWLRLRKNDGDIYTVEILLGEKTDDF